MKLGCADCEQQILQAGHLDDVRQNPAIAAHLAECPLCADLFGSLEQVKGLLDGYRVEEPSEALIQAVLVRSRRHLHPAGSMGTVPSRATLFRVVFAGLAALPFVLLINTVLGWGVYELALHALPRTAALYCVALFVAWATLGTSLSYASLPFLSLLAGKPKVLSGPEEMT